MENDWRFIQRYFRHDSCYGLPRICDPRGDVACLRHIVGIVGHESINAIVAVTRAAAAGADQVAEAVQLVAHAVVRRNVGVAQ